MEATKNKLCWRNVQGGAIVVQVEKIFEYKIYKCVLYENMLTSFLAER